MKRLKKIIQLTTHIYKLYLDIINMDLQGLNGTCEYLQKIEDLKLYKEFEEKYYEELSKKYNEIEMANIIGHLNIDNIVDPSASDLEFSTYDFLEPAYEESIIKRRIYNRLNIIMIDKTHSDELFGYIKDSLGTEIVNRESFKIGDRKIFIFDRVHTLFKLLQSAKENLYLRYIYYIQRNLFKHLFEESFVSKKYMFPFINKNIENRFIEKNFKIDISFIKNIKEGNSELNQEIYEFFLLKNSIELFDSVIIEALNLENYNMSKIDKEFYMIDFSAVIRASLLEMSESLIEMELMVLNNEDAEDYEDTKELRKQMTKIIVNGTKEKKRL